MVKRYKGKDVLIFYSDHTNEDFIKRLIKNNRIISIVLLVIFFGILTPLILLIDDLIFKGMFVFILVSSIVMVIAQNRSYIRKSIAGYKPQNLILLYPSNIIIRKKYTNQTDFNMFRIPIGNISNIRSDATDYLNAEKSKFSWFRRNLWGGWIPDGALWRPGVPLDYHLLIDLKRSMKISVPWRNPKGGRLEWLDQTCSTIILTIQSGHKKRFIEALRERMKRPHKAEKIKVEKTKDNKEMITIYNNPKIRTVMKYIVRIYLWSFGFLMVSAFLIINIMKIILMIDMISAAFVFLMFTAMLLIFLTPVVLFFIFLDFKSTLKRIRDFNKLLLKTRYIESHVKSEGYRNEFVNKIPLEYIRRIGIESYQNDLRNKKQGWKEKLWPYYYSSVGTLHHMYADPESLIRIELDHTIQVTYDLLGRKNNTIISGPVAVNEVILSLPVDKRDEFIRYIGRHSGSIIID